MTRYIEIDRHIIKEKLDSRMTTIAYVPSKHQLAEALTKGLPLVHFQDHTSKLGMIDTHSPAQGGV